MEKWIFNPFISKPHMYYLSYIYIRAYVTLILVFFRLRWHISRIHGIEHTLDELDCMLVGEEIKLKAQLQPALLPDSKKQCAEIEGDDLDDY